MKSFSQLSEDIEERRAELKQRSQERMQKFKQQSAAAVDAANKRAADAQE